MNFGTSTEKAMTNTPIALNCEWISVAKSTVNFSVTFEQQQEKFQSNLSERKEVIIKIVKNPVKRPTNWKDNYLSYISEKVTVIENRWPVQKIKINSQKSSVNTFQKYCVYNSSQKVKQSPTKNISHKKNLKRKTVINDLSTILSLCLSQI
jgi:hypothetical protein